MHFRSSRAIFILIIALSFSNSTFSQSNYLTDSDKKGVIKKTKNPKYVKNTLKKKTPKNVSLVDPQKLLTEAKIAVLKENNYPKAKNLLFTALKKSPGNPDVQIFLARVYGWTDKYDSSVYYYEKVLAKNPKNEEAAILYSDFEYRLSHYDQSLKILDNSLVYNSSSSNLLKRKAKASAAIADIQKAKMPNKSADSGNISTSKPDRQIYSYDIEKPQSKIINKPYSDSLSSDELLILARNAAFKEDNYDLAKGYLYRAYKQSPNYADIQIFLGRIYNWTNKYDSSKYFFESALQKKPGYVDAISAYTDLEYFNDHYIHALNIVESGLQGHPDSKELLVKKARILIMLQQFKAANSIVTQLLQSDHKDTIALNLSDKIKVQSAYNIISVGYDFSYFDKQFSDPWHLLSAEYGRKTGIGKIIGRINYANRFAASALQYEMDAYPHISKTFNAYLSFGVPVENKSGVFPKFRAGFSLYANLPSSFTGELGIRYLRFTGVPTYIYTASLGKYVGSWLFTSRVYLVPSDYSNTTSVSVSLSAAYYLGGSSDNVITGTIGYGSSPDDRSQGILAIAKLKSYKFSSVYKKSVRKVDYFSLSAGISATEYLPGVHGNEYDLGVSYNHRF